MIQTDSVAVQNARDLAPGEEVFVMPLAIFALTIAAYAIGIGGILAMTGWSWQRMRAAERRRDKAREKPRDKGTGE